MKPRTNLCSEDPTSYHHPLYADIKCILLTLYYYIIENV